MFIGGLNTALQPTVAYICGETLISTLSVPT